MGNYYITLTFTNISDKKRENQGVKSRLERIIKRYTLFEEDGANYVVVDNKVIIYRTANKDKEYIDEYAESTAKWIESRANDFAASDCKIRCSSIKIKLIKDIKEVYLDELRDLLNKFIEVHYIDAYDYKVQINVGTVMKPIRANRLTWIDLDDSAELSILPSLDVEITQLDVGTFIGMIDAALLNISTKPVRVTDNKNNTTTVHSVVINDADKTITLVGGWYNGVPMLHLS